MGGGKLKKEEKEYKPKIKMNLDDEDDDPKVFFIESKKNESLKYAEELLANFDDGGGEEDAGSQPNTETPRIVIKFSKNKDPAKNIPKDNNGLTKPPVQKAGDSDMQKKLPKLKIKNLIEPNPS